MKNQLKNPFKSEPIKKSKGHYYFTKTALTEFKKNYLASKECEIQKKFIKEAMLTDDVETPKDSPISLHISERNSKSLSWKDYLNTPNNTFQIITATGEVISSVEFYNRVMNEAETSVQSVLNIFP